MIINNFVSERLVIRDMEKEDSKDVWVIWGKGYATEIVKDIAWV